mgnify:CR=1 FL=1
MTKKKAYSGTPPSGCVSLFPGIRRLSFLIFVVLATVAPLIAQDDLTYDETSVYLKIPLLGISEIDAVIRDGEVYLPVTNLFDLLKIRNVPSEDLDLITGFFISPEATYSVDRRKNEIIYSGKTYPLGEGDLVRSETNLYLKALYFGKIFGLDCKFSFRDLTVSLETKLELPGIREMKLEEMRSNLTRLKGELQVDTTVARSYPGFRFGMADWSVYANEQVGVSTDARLNLALGSVIAGGEATVSLNYYTGEPFSEKQQHYLWRHVDNERPLLRQFMAGKIVSHATASIYNPVLGVQLTSTPTTFRRSFGSYTLTDRTEPGWTVELYVNNVLVDYVKADASGFFTFEVPLVYGNTQVKLKFYGPWGEERTREQNIAIPYNFLPHKEFEYTLSAGVVEDTLWSRYSRASVSYGATRFLTLGGGAEYLSSVTTGPLMPFVNASLRISNNLLLSGEYAYGVRSKGTLTYRLPSNMQLDLSYTRYDRDQKAINYNYLEERRAALSLPMRIKKFTAYSRFSYYQVVLPVSDYTTVEWLLAGSLLGINTNLTTYAILAGQNDPNIYSNLSFSVRLPASILLMPQMQYSYTYREILSSKISLEKRMFERGYLTASYEQNFRNSLRMGELGFRYDFSFAQTGFSARQSNKQTTFVQYARGSLINDRETDYLKADNRTNVGRGGISLVAFLDINSNGQRDPGEPKAYGLNLRSNGGRIERSEKDTVIHILGLEPYVKYFIELDEAGFDNISWRLKKRSYAVIIDPNMLKMIEVPVAVEGEATGTVMAEKEGVLTGLARIIVNFYSYNGVLKGKTLTVEDGYFSYFGVAPGRYYARIDTAQLRKLSMTSTPDSIPFTVKTDLDGDYIEGLDFVLKKIVSDTLPKPPVTEMVVERDTSYLVIHEEVRELVTITEDYWAIQLGAFKNKANAETWMKRIAAVVDKDVEIISEDGFYKVRVTGFRDREELDSYIPVLDKAGFTEIWVIHNKAKKIERITTKQDTVARITETVVERPRPVIIAGTVIQVASFRNQEEVSAIIDRLLAAGENLITVRNEGGVYKVQIADIKDTAEIQRLIPILEKKGFRNMVLIDPQGALIPVAGARTDSLIVEEAKVDTGRQAEKVVEEEVAPVPATPGFALHAARYYRRGEAERAKNRIIRKLKLPVEIIQEWDSYRVVVTGFFTPEETFRYYPELAGLGFTEVFVMELPQQKKQ